MKITAVHAIPVSTARRQAYGQVTRTALGPAGMSEHVIVRLETDAGIEGVGEVSSVFARKGLLYCNEIERVLGPALLGEDPFRIAHLNARMDLALDRSEPAKAALDMACHDIVGKALGTPVYNLLGGMVRERIELCLSIPFGDAAQMAEQARAYVARGFRTVKVKVGRGHRIDVDTVAAVRDAVGPEVIVRVDANMAWRTAKEAVAIIRDMEEYRPELVEQPLPPRELDALAEIRCSVGVPIMVDESVWGPRDALEVIRRGAADIANIYVSESGGLYNAARSFGMFEEALIPCMIGSMPEFGIGTAAQIHLGTAMRNLGLASDTCGVLYHEEDCLVQPLRIDAGYAYPPEGPGLGIEVDWDVVERWRIRP